MTRYNYRQAAWIVLFLGAMCLLIALFGCGSPGKAVTLPSTYIPREPDKPPAHVEAEQQAVDYTQRFLDRVFEWGLAPKAPAAKQTANLMAETVRSLGQPVNPIPLQVAEEEKAILPSREVAELTAELRRLTAAYRQALADFKVELEAARKHELEEGSGQALIAQPWWLTVLKRSLWVVILIGVPVLIAIFPAFGAAIMFVLRGLWRFVLSGLGKTPTATPAEALPQVVAGVQEFRDTMKADPEFAFSSADALRMLNSALAKAQNPTKGEECSPVERAVIEAKRVAKLKGQA